VIMLPVRVKFGVEESTAKFHPVGAGGVAFSALTLLVGRQEGHPVRKKYGGMVEVGTG